MPTPGHGSRRDFAALEARRLQAAQLFAGGESQAAVARRLDVTTAAANHWYQTWRAEGRAGLKAARAGRKPRPRAPRIGGPPTRPRGGAPARGGSGGVWGVAR